MIVRDSVAADKVRVRLAPGTSPASGRALVEAAAADFPGLAVMDRSQVLADQESQVNRMSRP